jgi:CRISPR-associated protein Cas1
MNFRVVYITNSCKLNFKNNSLQVENEKGITKIPLSDISTILIENLSVNLTSYLLSKIAENKINLIVCSENHLPEGIYLPFNGKVRMLEAYKYQINVTDEFLGNLWIKIIKNKIENQAQVLNYANALSYIQLINQIPSIEHNDKTNIEAYSSSIYWKDIFFNSLDYFTRNCDDIRNSALNYGYAIIRSSIANSLACKGFLPFYGIHHKNQLNQFNLADDVIEPFRPLVDLEVYEIFENEGYELDQLDKELKKRLISLLDTVVLIDNEKFTLINAIDKYTDSLFKCFKTKNYKYLVEIKLWI